MNAVDLLVAAGLPVVPEPAEAADLLVAITHRAIPDRSRFGVRYWDALAERVRAGTYTGLTLRSWWRRVAADLDIGQPRREDGRLLVGLLDGGGDENVLRVLREDTHTVVLRVRLAVAATKNEEG